MELCSRCVTPASLPGIQLDQSGVCSHCRGFESAYRAWAETKASRLARFERMIAWAKRRRRAYDAIVPLSGGKDSTYVLYLATKKYQLNVLCCTFDNGYQTEVASANIAKAIERSGADLVVFRPNAARLNGLYKHFVEHTGMFCPVCMRGIYGATFAVMRAFDIPLVLKGTSARTEERLPAEIFQDGGHTFFRNVLKANPSAIRPAMLDSDRTLQQKLRRAVFLLSRGRISLGTIEVQMPDFVDWDYREIYETISTQMGWQQLADRDEHVDCLLDPVAHYTRRLRVPELTSSMLRYSGEIRSGQRTREDALRAVAVEQERERDSVPQELDLLLKGTAMSAEQFAGSFQNCFRHMRYQRDSWPIRLIRRVLH